MRDQQRGIGRRSFMKAAGTVAGASLLGVGTAAGADASGFDADFANWRVREARKVWARGFTGRHDRTIALTDSGIEARHPDLGPWNGVTATEGEDGLVLNEVSSSQQQVPVREAKQVATDTFTGQTAPGGGVVGFNSTTGTFTLAETADQVTATLTWNVDNPEVQANDADVTLLDADGEPVATSGSGGTETQQAPEEVIQTTDVTPGAAYSFEVTCWRGAVNWEISVSHEELVDTGEFETRSVTSLSAFDGDVFGDATNKTFGWFDGGPRYGSYRKPRDGNGHGTHCSSIMGGSGRASVVDEAGLVQEEPRATLVAGDFLAYEVDVDADGGVFAAAYGDGIELAIEAPDGREIEAAGLNADHSLFDNNLIDHPAVHDSGTATYTVYVRPYTVSAEGTSATSKAATVDRVSVGPLLPPAEAGEGSRDGHVSLHAGVAPDAGLVGLQGLSVPTAKLGEYADDFAGLFNVRAVNMSWGYTGGAPIGAAGGLLESTAFGENLPQRLKQIAAAGILPVAAAGNAATPANGNGDPGVADEAVSVAATDPVDGLVSYSSGGVGGVDEEGVSTEDSPDDGDQPAYMKPDVTAPGGAADGYPGGAYDLIRAARNGSPNTPESEQSPIRDYTLKAGTSMAAPYVTGTVGLLAQAMEEAAPSRIALPEPSEATYEDAMRLKQALLATASETAFTAAPFHHPTHRPTYEHGGRDPYEGFGRVNPDAAVDAVSHTLVDGSGVAPNQTASFDELASVGLDLPEDSRAVAGHVVAPDGTIDASVAFSHYAGGNKGMAKDVPWLDLFVYDAEAFGTNGEPNIVASAQGNQGSASVSVDVTESDSDVYYVVAKLVNVPGAVNTYDVQARFDLAVDYTAAQRPALTATGSRMDDGSVFTAGQTNQVDVTVSGLSEQVPDDAVVEIYDHSPWPLAGVGSGDAESRSSGGRVDLGTATAGEVRDGGVTRTYFVEAPSETGQYTFGAASVELASGIPALRTDTATVGGTDTNYVVGADQSDPTGSATGGTTDLSL